MKVNELLSLLLPMDTDAEVVLSGPDHRYYKISACVERKAEDFRAGRQQTLLEYHDDHNKSDPKSEVIEVVLIG